MSNSFPEHIAIVRSGPSSDVQPVRLLELYWASRNQLLELENGIVLLRTGVENSLLHSGFAFRLVPPVYEKCTPHAKASHLIENHVTY
jgi:hypothetical protein